MSSSGSFGGGGGGADLGITDLASSNASSPGSPLFDFLTAFAPRKLKDLFRLCEYLYFNSAQIYAALQKFCTYPVTDIIYETQNEALKSYYEDLHNIKLKKLAFNYVCKGCNTRVDAGEKDVVDRKITRKDRISVIRWDSKLMDIDYNPITGH